MALVRGPAFAEAVWQTGKCDPTMCDMDDDIWLSILARYPKPPPPLRIGDAVAAVATPIARVLRLSCIDPATRQLRPESGCAKRKAALNRLTQ